MSLRLFSCLILAAALPGGEPTAAEIAITFDDAPRSDSRLMSGAERTDRLISALDGAGVEGAIFFSTGQHIDSSGHERLLRYQQAGHYIANHSFSHARPHDLGLAQWLEDLQQADAALRQFDGFLPLYRFPFLDEGRDEDMRDGMRQGLAQKGYRNGYVTVDNYDWYMDRLLQEALEQGRTVDFEALGRVYVNVLADCADFYDRVAQDALGRSPRHVLLLHENDLAALYLGDLAAELRRRGWSIISGPLAYRDPIAEHLPDTLFNNQGRVAALAAVAGAPRISLIHVSEDEGWLQSHFESEGIFGAKSDDK